CFFFFSSRRRHTRSKRDWSSDVCSSDLTAALPAGAALVAGLPCANRADAAETITQTHTNDCIPRLYHGVSLGWRDTTVTCTNGRSEERRVGKECRDGWEQDQ